MTKTDFHTDHMQHNAGLLFAMRMKRHKDITLFPPVIILPFICFFNGLLCSAEQISYYCWAR